jgi:hypothetical protein
MRLSRTQLYDLPLLIGVRVGAVIGLIAGDLLTSILLGFVFGNAATTLLRYQSGSMTPTLSDRWRSRQHGGQPEPDADQSVS